MKLKILDVQTNVNKKSGVINYKAIGLGEFSSYGNIQPATIEISLTEEQHNELLKYKNKELDLDLVIPLPTFPLTLNSLNLS